MSIPPGHQAAQRAALDAAQAATRAAHAAHRSAVDTARSAAEDAHRTHHAHRLSSSFHRPPPARRGSAVGRFVGLVVKLAFVAFVVWFAVTLLVPAITAST